MKLHNPLESHDLLPGFCALLSIVIIFSLAAAIYPPVIFGVLLLPIIYTIRYMTKGE